MKLDGIKQGKPSWADLMTTDVGGAVSFYDALFGWGDVVAPIPGGGEYHTATLGEARVCGIAAQDEAERAGGVPAHWNVFFAVDSTDATVSRVAGAGGQVIAPTMDVMGLGNMAVLADPTGGVVGLWQAKSHKGFGVAHEPGSISWCELMTDDAGRAAAFYSTILDVPSQPMDMGPDAHPYILLGPTNEEGAGIMGKTSEMAGVPTSWGIYFEVADADATAERAQSLGGTVMVPPTDIMPGRFAMLVDPQGAVFGIIKSNPM